MAKSNEKALDYAGDFGSHSGFCWLFRAFSSDYMPLSLCNSAFSSFSELSGEKLAQINFFQAIAYNIPRNSSRIQFFFRGEMIWDEQISELLQVSNRGLIEMYKFRVNRHQENP